MVERAMGQMLLLVQPPRFILRLSISEGRKVVHGQAFIAQSAVNARNEGVLNRFSGPNEVALIPRRYAKASSPRDWNFIS
jgi:hypothetical protein